MNWGIGVSICTLFSFPKVIFYNFIYFWLCWVFVTPCNHYLVLASKGNSLVAPCGLLIAMVSLVVEYGL